MAQDVPREAQRILQLMRWDLENEPELYRRLGQVD
jgi:hypothetical protein